jgi:hypothetical protein
VETLHQRFADLAEDAPESPTPPGIWTEGRRRARSRRVGTAVVAAAMTVALVAVGGFALHRGSAPHYAGQPGAQPGLPSQIYHPSPWLSGTDGHPPGQLSMLIPGKRGGWPHYHWGMVGVSATTGAYHYLEIPGCLDVYDLSPDGQHVSCFTGTGSGEHEVLRGLAVYDTVTGHLDRWTPRSGRVGLNTVAWNGNGAISFRAGQASYLWHFENGAPRPISSHLTRTVGTAGTADLYLSGHHGYFYLDPAHHRQVERVTLPAGQRATGPAAVSPSGRRVAMTGVSHASGSSDTSSPTSSWLQVGETSAGGQVGRFARVPAAVQWPLIVGWADEQHLLVVSEVSPHGAIGSSDPNGRYALDSVDVGTGQVVQVAGMSDEQTSEGAIFATSMLGAPTRDFPAPPHPINQRLELGLVVGLLLLGGVALVIWRRRVRP